MTDPGPGGVTQHQRTFRALNRLTKWRTLFAGWQLGTTTDNDTAFEAIRDHREVTLLHRAELTALVSLLADTGVITRDDWDRHLETAADQLSKALSTRFPGIEATEHGLTMDLTRAVQWMHDLNWLP